jgi:hypothetical protein
MDENPYKSPQALGPAEKKLLPPLWRRVVSIPMLIFGVGYVLNSPTPYVSGHLQGQPFIGALLSALLLIGGIALIWVGIRLRRL